jgi:hypothetical protein
MGLDFFTTRTEARAKPSKSGQKYFYLRILFSTKLSTKCEGKRQQVQASDISQWLLLLCHFKSAIKRNDSTKTKKEEGTGGRSRALPQKRGKKTLRVLAKGHQGKATATQQTKKTTSRERSRLAAHGGSRL